MFDVLTYFGFAYAGYFRVQCTQNNQGFCSQVSSGRLLAGRTIDLAGR